jgi:cardiolipin synthase A/B
MGGLLDWFFSTIWPWVLALLHTVLTLVASAHVVLTKRDSRAALGWVGIIWLTPLVGTVLYVLFGVNRIQRKAQQLRAENRLADAEAEFERCRHRASEDVLRQVLGGEAQHLLPLANFIARVTDLPLLDGNRLTPLTTGRQTYDEMLAAIDRAERSVGLEVYIFDNDPLGQQFVAALDRAQQRGVEVRVLIDDVGARYTWPSIKRVLRRRGIRYSTFLPTLIPGKLHYTNLRNHRKIMVVDGELGFTGGINIRHGHLCEPGDPHPVQDLHFRVEGPIVAQLRETFASDWAFATGESLEGPGWFPRLSPRGHTLCRGISDGPDVDFDKLRLAILGAVGCARHTLYIVTPYFLPEPPLITALNVAAMRGVAVNIILPEKNNLKLVEWACMAQLWQMLERGCRIWLTPPPFDHTKLMVVDGVWSFVGSANWDPRSLRLNFEYNVECYDRELAAQLSALVHDRRRAGRELTLHDVDSRPLWMRLRDGVCRLALPYL